MHYFPPPPPFFFKKWLVAKHVLFHECHAPCYVDVYNVYAYLVMTILAVQDVSEHGFILKSSIPYTFRVLEDELIHDCSEVRRRAYATFDPDITLDHFGRYGNSDPSNTSQWSRIINETVDSNDEVIVTSHAAGVI